MNTPVGQTAQTLTTKSKVMPEHGGPPALTETDTSLAVGKQPVQAPFDFAMLVAARPGAGAKVTDARNLPQSEVKNIAGADTKPEGAEAPSKNLVTEAKKSVLPNGNEKTPSAHTNVEPVRSGGTVAGLQLTPSEAEQRREANSKSAQVDSLTLSIPAERDRKQFETLPHHVQADIRAAPKRQAITHAGEYAIQADPNLKTSGALRQDNDGHATALPNPSRLTSKAEADGMTPAIRAQTKPALAQAPRASDNPELGSVDQASGALRALPSTPGALTPLIGTPQQIVRANGDKAESNGMTPAIPAQTKPALAQAPRASDDPALGSVDQVSGALRAVPSTPAALSSLIGTSKQIARVTGDTAVTAPANSTAAKQAGTPGTDTVLNAMSAHEPAGQQIAPSGSNPSDKTITRPLAAAANGDGSAAAKALPARFEGSALLTRSPSPAPEILRSAEASVRPPASTTHVPEQSGQSGPAAPLARPATVQPLQPPQHSLPVADDMPAGRDHHAAFTPHSSSQNAPATTPYTASASVFATPRINATGLTTDLLTKVENAHSLLAPADTPEMVSWDIARTALTPHGTLAPLRTDLAPHVARQLVEGMAQAGHRPIEIALSPQELGRVRMSVVTEDGAITVSIIAERPETLDLMRRHIDQLGQTFKSMGYEAISFSFGQGADNGEQTSPGSQNSPNEGSDRSSLPTDPDAPAVIHLNAAPARGVDIRL